MRKQYVPVPLGLIIDTRRKGLETEVDHVIFSIEICYAVRKPLISIRVSLVITWKLSGSETF